MTENIQIKTHKERALHNDTVNQLTLKTIPGHSIKITECTFSHVHGIFPCNIKSQTTIRLNKYKNKKLFKVSFPTTTTI